MYLFVKRTFDIIVSGYLIIIFMPLLIVVAFLIKLSSDGPVFFIQQRLGYRGKLFKIYKFRSMTQGNRNYLLQIHLNSPEVTRVGKIIRRFKIDELPQLFNVFIGEMSLVGPRPCLEETGYHFNEDGHRRLLVRPGLTGLAQVSGNTFLDWPERWALDCQYVERISFLLDLKIIFKTLLIIALGEKWGAKGNKP